MNIIEAIKSGKPFKRKAWDDFGWYIGKVQVFELTKESLLADDWVIEESNVAITRTQFNEAWDLVIHFAPKEIKDALAKELGL